MNRMASTAGALALGCLLAAAAEAQRGPAQEPGVDVRVTAQLPVAVVRARSAGAPAGELADLIRELRRAEAPADEVIEIIRYAPIASEMRFPVRDGDSGAGARLSERIRFLRDRGVRGRELAEEIHRELRAQGIPAGRDANRGRPPPIARDYIPEEARRGRPERGNRPEMERRGPPADLRPDAAEDRPRGRPADAGQGQRGQPDEAGQGRRNRPPEAGQQQRPPPPANAGQQRNRPPADAGRQRGGPPPNPGNRRGGPPDDRRS